VSTDYYANDGGNLTTGTTPARQSNTRDNLHREIYNGNARDIQMDGHQRIVHGEDGRTIIYNYGTINFNRCEQNGGIDYRNEGQGNYDFRRYTAPNREGNEQYQGRLLNAPRHEYWDDDRLDQLDYRNWTQQRSQYDYNQRSYAREYPDYVYPQRQPILPGQRPNYYEQQQQYNPNQYAYNPNQYAYNPNQYAYNPNQYAYNQNRYAYNPNQSGVDGVINDVGRLASIALPFAALALHRGGAFIPYQSPYSYQQYPQQYAGNWNNSNFYANQNTGNYWNGGYVPGTYNPGYNPLQPQGYLPNNAYAWQQQQLQMSSYAPQPSYAAPSYWNRGYQQTTYAPNSYNYQNSQYQNYQPGYGYNNNTYPYS
jgi:hypothetical protein